MPCPLLWAPPPRRGRHCPTPHTPLRTRRPHWGPSAAPLLFQNTELWPQSAGPRRDRGLRDRVHNTDCKSVHRGASRTLPPAAKPRTPVGRISVAGPGARDSGAGPGTRRVRSRALRPSPPTRFLKGVWWLHQEPGSVRGRARGGGVEWGGLGWAGPCLSAPVLRPLRTPFALSLCGEGAGQPACGRLLLLGRGGARARLGVGGVGRPASIYKGRNYRSSQGQEWRAGGSATGGG